MKEVIFINFLKRNRKIILELFLFGFLLFWLSLFLFQHINLATADLGRHIKNGEIFLTNFHQFGFQNKVLLKNFYSYTYPDVDFLNHHWASGVLFYIIFSFLHFKGLHFFFIFLNLLTFSIFFWIAKEKSNFSFSFLFALLLIPLIGSRTEVRPEIFSYFFSAIFFLLFYLFQKDKISPKILVVSLFTITMLWVNLHSYFIFSLIITSSFLLEEIIKCQSQKRIKVILICFFIVLLAFFFNPQGWKIFNLFFIFQNYGYRVLENQSIFFLEKLNLSFSNFFLFKIAAFLLIISSIFILIKRQHRPLLSFYLPALLSTGMTLIAIRNFALFALFALPTLSLNFYQIKNKFKIFASRQQNKLHLSIIFAILIFTFNYFSQFENFSLERKNFGLGLSPGVEKSAEFFKNNKLKGPIFNNYDIGGYLIYYLYPEKRVFVDNRPESYPASFFNDIYIPMQEKEEIWRKMNDFYKFNAIFFYRHDFTPWAQPFLIKRLDDPEWEPVFVDNFAIIFLRNTKENQDIIEKYKIPKEYFQIIRTK